MELLDGSFQNKDSIKHESNLSLLREGKQVAPYFPLGQRINK